MDLRRLRTFVAITELGTVSRAALHLRISQSALSRQISELEQEFRVRLFDRVGRRLVLTAIGDQLLGDCRSVLGQVGSLGERVQLLRGGERGVLKVAASPQMIESVLSTFLPRYAARFPNVQVKLTEALGPPRWRCWNAARCTWASGTIRVSVHPLPVTHCCPTRSWPRPRHLSELAPAKRSISGASRPIPCCCWSRGIRYVCNSMPLAVWQTS